MNTPLQIAAKAVLDRWNSPRWEWHRHGPTGELMTDLYVALLLPVEPTARPRERETDFQIALIKELADVKQSLLATQGQLETSQRMLGNCHKELMVDVSAAPLPSQPAKEKS